MKVVILAGGFGTRISEESVLKPKPMVEIGDKPILWHIMKLYSYYGYNEFVICCGYKQHMIKEWFADYYLHSCDVTFDFTRENKMTVHNNISEPWKVTLVDTGLNTMTGGRIKRVREHLNGEPFFLTYGDGVADINIAELLKFHQEGGRMATLTSVQPMGRFGALDLREDGEITNFKEKKQEDSGWINAGFIIDPLIALPIGGLSGILVMRKWRTLKESLSYGLDKMSIVAILLIGTGTLAGIIKASSIKDLLLDVLSHVPFGDIFIAPLSGVLMSAATASTTAGATVASASFSETILAAGISSVWGAAMINAGATVLDHLPHGSFFHTTGGVTHVNISDRLKLIPYETAIGVILTISSVILCLLIG